jgi:hypothetical protein
MLKAERKLLSRYMGKEGIAAFHAYHAVRAAAS